MKQLVTQSFTLQWPHNIGSGLVLSVRMPTLKNKVNLICLKTNDNSIETQVLLTIIEIVNLLRQALVKIPLLPFSLALEKWRWNVMAGRIKPEHYNKDWWDLKLKYQGNVWQFYISVVRPN